ncbi:MAG: glycosyltransferase N-terminal domain-containing protein [Ignavibacterium sp.]
MIDKIWLSLYNLFVVPILYSSFRLLGIFNSKVKEGVNGRKRLLEDLILNATKLDKTKKLIWFHSSSLGEFEQAKPIIERLKKKSNVNILITFFSPSGYLNSKNYPYADLISYIPFDTKGNVKRFITIVNPSVAVFMRYDLWPNIIKEIHKNKIPILLVDATMRKNSPRKFFIGKSFHKSLFKMITKILTVTSDDANNFKSFDCEEEKLLVVGDTRFDRVYQKSIIAKERKLINDEILKNKKVIVAGSTWSEDEEVIIPIFQKLVKYESKESNENKLLFIIAPHEPTILHLEKLENDFNKTLRTIRFSYLNNYLNESIILIDSIGILSTLYYYANIAFIGGSFKSNVHNVLEAAVYGMPVLYGPKIFNSQEAKRLNEIGGGIIIHNQREGYRMFKTLLLNDELREKLSNVSKKFVENNLSATDKILKVIYEYL